MSSTSDAPSANNLLLDQDQTQDHPLSAQHSRSSSVQSSTTDYAAKEVPEIVRRDMEFFMARLTRTTSNDSTSSTEST